MIIQKFSKNVLVASVLSVGICQNVFAFCWGSGCLFYVPIYDQTSKTIPTNWFKDGVAAESQLCAPTAGAMAMQGLLQDLAHDNVHAAGWVLADISGKSMSQQIVDTATLMQTSPANGTGTNNLVNSFTARAGDYVYSFPVFGLQIPITHASTNSGAQVNLGTFQNIFKSGVTGMVTNYGHYTRVSAAISTPTLKQVTVSYSRNGGHVVTPRGYISNLIVFNDPEGGVLQFTELMTLTAKNSSNVSNGVHHVSIETLPGGQSTSSVYQLYQGGSYYPIIESMSALTAPFQN